MGDSGMQGTTVSSGSAPHINWANVGTNIGLVLCAALAVVIILYALKKICRTPAFVRDALERVRASRDRGRRTEQNTQLWRPYLETSGMYGHTGEITFCEKQNKQGLYDLQFILKASVQIPGPGSLGSTYKIILQDGSQIVVKRLKEDNPRQRDFEQIVTKLGQISMENIIPVQSYYYSRGLAFLVYDYACLGSLLSLIQDAKAHKLTPLDWPTRLSIAMDVACAINSLHESSIVHGNIKSSNIFLDTDLRALVSEYGLVQMCSRALAEDATLGYKAPELADASTPTVMSDIYSMGVLFMELLTGVSPRSFHSQQLARSESKNHTDGSAMARSESKNRTDGSALARSESKTRTDGSALARSESKNRTDGSAMARSDSKKCTDGSAMDSGPSDLPSWVSKRSIEQCIDRQLSHSSLETTVVQMFHVAMACVASPVESRASMSTVLAMMKGMKYTDAK